MSDGILTSAELSIAAAIADTLIPEGGAFPAGGRTVDLAGRLDVFLTGERPELVGAVRSALWLVEWGGFVLAGRFGRFTNMSQPERTGYFATLPHRGPLARQIYAGLKQAFFFLFYAAEPAWQPIGYDGPWV